MSEKLIEALEKYADTFNGGFPTIPLLSGREEKEVIEMIETCIKQNKDVYDMGYLELSLDISY